MKWSWWQKPYQTAQINLTHVDSILILFHNPCNHCTRYCPMAKLISRHHSQSFIVKNCAIFSFSAMSVSYILSMVICRKCNCRLQIIFPSWDFLNRWKSRPCKALFIEVPLTQAQVSPGVTHNSLRGMSTQANLMGIPFPHTLGWPAYAGTTAANTPFTKVYSTTFVWWCDASQQDFILCASLT